MSENYDKFYAFAEVYKKRLGKDILALIRSQTLTPNDFEHKIDFLLREYSIAHDTYTFKILRLNRSTARKNECRIRFQDNGDGPAARIVNEYEYEQRKKYWCERCQKFEVERDMHRAKVDRISDEYKKCEAEYEDYETHKKTGEVMISNTNQ